MKVDSDLSPHPRYRLLNRIGKGGMGEVFRTYDRLTGQVVALKRVRLPLPTASAALPGDKKALTSLGYAPTSAPAAPHPPETSAQTLATHAPAAGSTVQLLIHQPSRFPSPPDLAMTIAAASSAQDGEQVLSVTRATLEAPRSSELQELRVHLTQEFRTLAGLRHPHIVSVLDYGFDHDRQPYFTMELLENGTPLDQAAHGQPFPVQVSLLLQLLQALTYLHRRGILHRDLKPGNILVTPGPRGPQVKVLDFGLALLAQDLRAQFAAIAGTLGYIAPEILVGTAPSEASDLFAVGVMAHEILVGTHPLGAQPTAVLIREFLGTAPLFSANERLGVALSAVLRRALCRAPSDRYGDAAAFAQDLARAAGLPIPAETAEIRESFLQAATFVAREEQLGTLRRAMVDAAAGHGALWLVGGESGVGKSRLIDELRTLALVRGTGVVRGLAVSTGGGGYQVWQGALRPLCLDTTLSDLDAGVLKAVVPDIAKLLDRPVPEPPALDPENAQTRFLMTVEKLLFSKRAPLVVLLEDLHWAEPGSIAVLSRLLRSVTTYPLLIIGSYRNDERPELPSELPGAQLLKLPRLVASEVERLSTSMLGEVGRRRDIVMLLERETAGNAFFIVEVVRALAEEVGTLGKIGNRSIPTHVVAGGVQAVLARRLGRVPAAARPLLYAAAVLGKELDLSVLQELPEELGEQIETHIAACAAVGVLEVNENRWRFAHDKLRDAVLAELPAAERASWHLRIGAAMERAYAADLGPHAATLGHHFDQADVPTRALPYLLQAGDRATPRGAMHEAIAHLDRAVVLFQRVAHTPAERARALGMLSRAYHGAGKAEESTRILEEMLADVGFPTPASHSQWLLDIARLISSHAQFRLGLRPHPPLASSEAIAVRNEVADVYPAVSEAVAETRSPARLLHLFFSLMAITERLNDPTRLAIAYAGIGFMLAPLPMAGPSKSYLRHGRTLLAQSPEPPMATCAGVEMAQASIHAVRGEWEQADQALAEEIRWRRRMGDWRHELLVLLQGACLMLWRGESTAGHAALKSLEALAHRVDSAQFACWGRCLHGTLALRAGKLDRAAQLVAEAGEYQSRTADPVSNLFFFGLSALCALRRQQLAESRRYADAALQLMRGIQTSVYGQILGIVATTEAYAGLESLSRDPAERAELQTQLRQSLALLRTHGALWPIGRPQTLLWHGRYAAQRGHIRLAGWLLRSSLRSAQSYRMPFDEALAHQSLAEIAPTGGESQSAAAHRHKARLLFERLGAHWHAAQISTQENDPPALP